MTKIQGFDWDQGNIGKVQKHGLSIKEIELFLERNPLLYSDIANSKSETRFFAFDRFGAKILFVVFTIRAIDRV
ncbi:BrnT family toxin [Bdellovibrio sp. HCB185ZH]|uniref:BrnT family toxin n=1 Tax=Bdellovibrio sp. HCB185ZH TaxID=3394235 RepID=UPI0039A4BFEC